MNEDWLKINVIKGEISAGGRGLFILVAIAIIALIVWLIMNYL